MKRVNGTDGPGRASRWTAVLAAGALYFGVVFAAGFLLGVARTLWLEPWTGERWAELIEMPFMLVVICLAARRIDGSLSLAARGRAVPAGVGAVALILLLAAELGLVVQLRGLGLSQYLGSRDPISGTAYALSLLVFAAMPTIVSSRPRPGGRPSA